MKSGVTVVLDEVAKTIDGIQKLASTRVMVGVPATKANREDGEPVNNAELAYIHDHGAPEAGIPAREFMMPGLEAKQDDIAAGLEKAGVAALDGKPDVVDRQFNIVGLKGQAAVRAKITEGPFDPLKEATLAARRRRGRTGTKPLIDTGGLRNSISYVIRKT